MAAYVQKIGTKWFGSSGLTEAVVLPGVTAGNTLVVFAGWNLGAVNISSIAGNGNTYATDITGITDSTVGQAKMYYVKAAAAGDTTITVTWGSDPGYGVLIAWEGTGRHATAPLDQQVASRVASPGSSPFAGGSVTPGQNNEWVVAGVFDEDGGTTFTVGAGFSHFEDQTHNGAGEDVEQTTATLVAAGWGTDAVFDTYLVILATFKPLGATSAMEWKAPAVQLTNHFVTSIVNMHARSPMPVPYLVTTPTRVTNPLDWVSVSPDVIWTDG